MNTTANTQTDRLGYTEREWESFWSSKNQNDGCQTAHMAKFDDENFCELCEQDVDYSNGYPGVCGCA
jgi:hypothetical protein